MAFMHADLPRQQDIKNTTFFFFFSDYKSLSESSNLKTFPFPSRRLSVTQISQRKQQQEGTVFSVEIAILLRIQLELDKHQKGPVF